MSSTLLRGFFYYFVWETAEPGDFITKNYFQLLFAEQSRNFIFCLPTQNVGNKEPTWKKVLTFVWKGVSSFLWHFPHNSLVSFLLKFSFYRKIKSDISLLWWIRTQRLVPWEPTSWDFMLEVSMCGAIS